MDVEDRDAAKRLFDSLGLDMTTAVNIFVKASLREKAIPFPIAAEQSDVMQKRFERELKKDLQAAEQDMAAGRTVDYKTAMDGLREKYGIQ